MSESHPEHDDDANWTIVMAKGRRSGLDYCTAATQVCAGVSRACVPVGIVHLVCTSGTMSGPSDFNGEERGVGLDSSGIVDRRAVYLEVDC